MREGDRLLKWTPPWVFAARGRLGRAANIARYGEEELQRRRENGARKRGQMGIAGPPARGRVGTVYVQLEIELHERCREAAGALGMRLWEMHQEAAIEWLERHSEAIEQAKRRKARARKAKEKKLKEKSK